MQNGLRYTVANRVSQVHNLGEILELLALWIAIYSELRKLLVISWYLSCLEIAAVQGNFPWDHEVYHDLKSQLLTVASHDIRKSILSSEKRVHGLFDEIYIFHEDSINCSPTSDFLQTLIFRPNWSIEGWETSLHLEAFKCSTFAWSLYPHNSSTKIFSWSNCPNVRQTRMS